MPSTMTGVFDWASFLDMVLQAVAVLLCLMVHEVCHGLAAWKLGDPTAKMNHRLSFNPIRHLDPFGLLMMMVVGFGWAKPVPVDPRYFRNPKSGMALTALAGPLSNFVFALVGAVFCNAALAAWYLNQGSQALFYTAQFFLILVSMNIGLGVFNLIPFPPLDGSKILGMFLPDRLYVTFLRFERYGMFLLMLVLWQGWLTVPLGIVRSGMFDFFMGLTSFAQTGVFHLLGG